MDTIANHPEVLSVLVALPLVGIVGKLFGVGFERIAKWYLYIAAFSVVIVMNSIFFPFIGGKDYFFRLSVELALIFFMLAWAFEARKDDVEDRVKALFKKPLFIAVSVFVLMVVLACLFAYDSSAAFWSNYERGESGFQMIHYYIFFVLMVLVLRNEDDWKNMFRSSISAAGLMILYGLFGNFGTQGFIGAYAGSQAPDGILHKLIDGRFQGSLGNPAYVAPYLIFSMFYAGYLWIRRKGAASKNVLMGIGYGLTLAVFLVFFILSQTRGAFLGLGVGAIVLVLYLIFWGRGGLRKWSLVALVVLIVLGGTGYAFRNSQFIQNLPEGRLLQLSFSDATAQSRFWTWNSAWQGFLERPILGWGPENFTAVFDKYFDTRHFVPGVPTETWFDRAHSVFFDYLAETGALGLFSYLVMFFIFFWEFFFKRRPAPEQSSAQGGAKEVLVHGLMVALPVAYLVQGAAIFDVFPMYINLFLFMAFSCYFFYNHQNHGQHN